MLLRVRLELSRLFLPPRCLLCGSGSRTQSDLCSDCAAEMPRNICCCPSCAMPMAQIGVPCGNCQRQQPPWQTAWAPFRYAWPLNLLEARFKFSASLASGRVLADLWSAAPRPEILPDCIVPVPLHRARLRQRGYNQALELARPLARALGIPVRTGVLVRTASTNQQTQLDAVGRRRNVRGAFALDDGVGLPAHVAVLDDVMTTGATLAECARTLKRAGVERVDVWALARAP